MEKYILPDLPYDYKALEPHIDEETMKIHHSKHHSGYVTKLNAALEESPELFDLGIEELLTNLERVPEKIRTAVRNNGGGHFNHSIFWQILSNNSKGKPEGKFLEAITKTFGSYEKFIEAFTKSAETHFGSGWAWVSVDKTGELIIHTTSNQDNPISNGFHPILGIDLWEHAYYLKYRNRRPDYVTAFKHVINWDQVEKNYFKVIEKLNKSGTIKERKVS